MNGFDILTGNGITILDRLHEQNQIETMDDAEYIPLIKIIIKGIQDYAIKLNLPKKQISEIEIKLKDYSRKLYLKIWLEQCKEIDGVISAEAESEGAGTFDYIYEYEEHPR
jgi:hypothetical protein